MLFNQLIQKSAQGLGASQSGVQKNLTRLFDGLFPSWPTILATLLAVSVLLIVMTKYLWKPIKKYVKNRQTFIQTNIDNSTKQQTEAISDRKKAFNELNIARVEADKIISNAKDEAKVVKKSILAEASEQTRHMLKSTQDEIVKERAKMKSESRKEIITIAFAAAEKIIGKNVNDKVNKRIIEEYINNDVK